ncbi:MAG: pilus assembly protein PilN [Candidatus Electrothrix sp. AW1]|nr:pilus assembly protein PilN [Candidatus Electrothrix sp. AX1]MCI5181234.1 pilus assembly protein PilN [Candidatus Electrothrix gigas]
MIRINLLPVRQMKKKTQALRLLFLSGVAIVATVVVLLLATGFLSTRVSGLEKSIKDLTVRKNELQKTLDLIEKLEQKKKLVEQQTGVVNQLKQKSQLTVRILDDVATKTPHERMWLESLSQDPNSLKLSGMALDNRTIANYLKELKKSSYLDNVTLGSTTLRKYGGRNLQQFSLTCSIKLPEAADEAAKDNGKK